MLRRFLFAVLGLLCLSAAHAQQGAPTNNPGGSGSSVSLTAGSSCLLLSPSPITGTGTIDIGTGLTSGTCGGLAILGANTFTGLQTLNAGASLASGQKLNFAGATGEVDIGGVKKADYGVTTAANWTFQGTVYVSSVSGSNLSTNNVTSASGGGFIIGARSQIYSLSDGNLIVANNAGTAFTCLALGVNTTSFPAICRSAAILKVRLGDNSGDADLSARLLITAGFTVAGLPAAGTAGRRAFVTDQLTTCAVVGAALTGGGAVTCPVFDNGAAWVGG